MMRVDRTAGIVATSPWPSLSTAAAARLAEIENPTSEQRAALQTKLMKAELGLTGNRPQQVSHINLEHVD